MVATQPNLVPANPFANAPNNGNGLLNQPNMSTINGPVYAPPPTMPSAPTNQSVLSHTVTDAAGNSTTQKYAPSSNSTGVLGAQNQNVAAGAGTPGYTYVNGILTSVGGVPTGYGGSTTPTPPASSSNSLGTANPNAGFGGGLMAPNLSSTAPTAQANGTLSNQQNTGGTSVVPQTSNLGTSTVGTTPTASGLLSTVAAYGQQDPGLTGLYNQQQALTADYANRVGNIQSTPTTLNEQTGRLASIQDEYNTAEANLANTYQANLAQRTQGIGASESALGTATQQVSSPYGTPLVNPATGQTISGGQSTGLLNSSGTGGVTSPGIPPTSNLYPEVQYWAQQVANGYPVSSLPAPFNNGVVQTQIQQMAASLPSSSGSTYNPVTTSQNVQGATSQNILTSQGYAAQASAVNQVQNNISTLAPQVQSFMVANGINNQSGLPIINGAILTYLQNSNPGAASSWTQYVNELNNYASQILATKGITPTGSESQLTNLNLNTLTSDQLNTFLQTLNNVATSYHTQLTTSAHDALNTNNQPGSLYTGNAPAPTPTTVTTPVATPNISNNNPTWVKAFGGFVMGTVNEITGLAGSLLGSL